MRHLSIRKACIFVWGKSVFFLWGNPYKIVDFCKEGSHEVFLGIWRRPSGGGVRGCETRLFRRGKTLTEAKLDEFADIFNSNLLHQAAAVGIYCLG